MKKQYVVIIQYWDNTKESEPFATKAEAQQRKEYLKASGYTPIAIKRRYSK